MSIKDIAKLAGVSPATVSRVLNNPEHRCSSEEVRQRIWRIAREQNYLPNAAARSLKLGSPAEAERPLTHVDVLMTRSGGQQANPFYNELLRYVENEVHRQHAVLRSVWYDRAFADPRSCNKRTAARMVDKLVPEQGAEQEAIAVIGRCAPDALRAFAARYKAVVSINRNPTDFIVDQVTSDGARLAAKAVDYLVSLGHRRIGYAGSVRDESWYRGYQRALTHHGIDLDVEDVFECDLSETAGFDIMNGLMRRDGAPTAIFCSNDMLALGMIRCMMTRGSRYYRPSIIGCDDIEEGQFCRPMLTSLSVSKRDLARFGMRLLFDRLAGGHSEPARVELDGKLMTRESCWRCTSADDIEYII